MKKRKLIALAALATAGAASAQSNLTIFGVVDASVSSYSSTSRDESASLGFNALGQPVFRLNQGSRKVSRTAVSPSGFNTSRFGFRGTEDLGGGLAASFWLEAPINNDDGSVGIATFSRRATVSLSGGFGEVRLGHDYVPTFWNDTVFDPFGTNGVGTNLIFRANAFTAGGLTNVRSSNSIGYFLPPQLGGFYGNVLYGLHENTKFDPGTATPVAPNNSRTGRYIGARIGYANGPLDVALASGNSTVGDNFFGGSTDSVKTTNLGASYAFGPVKLFGELSRAKTTRSFDGNVIVPAAPLPDVDLKGYLLGFTAPIGPGLIRAAYSHVKYDQDVVGRADPEASKLALGYVHHLSKRTALYATVARVRNKNGAALTVGGPAFISNATFTPRTSTGYDLGIRHAF